MNPRDLLIPDHRRLFGRASAVKWSASAPAVEVRAAQMQHDAARSLVELMKVRGQTTGEVADEWHFKAEGVRRKLRGETWASLRDLAMWSLYVEQH